jgi:hypothetical protein
MNRQSTKRPTLLHLEFHKKVIEELAGNVEKNDPKERKSKLNVFRRPSEWQTAPNSGRDGKVTKDCEVCSLKKENTVSPFAINVPSDSGTVRKKYYHVIELL